MSDAAAKKAIEPLCTIAISISDNAIGDRGQHHVYVRGHLWQRQRLYCSTHPPCDTRQGECRSDRSAFCLHGDVGCEIFDGSHEQTVGCDDGYDIGR